MYEKGDRRSPVRIELTISPSDAALTLLAGFVPVIPSSIYASTLLSLDRRWRWVWCRDFVPPDTELDSGSLHRQVVHFHRLEAGVWNLPLSLSIRWRFGRKEVQTLLHCY